MNYPTTPGEINTLHALSRSGDLEARWTVAMLGWAVRKADRRCGDPLASDVSFACAWNAWKARGEVAAADRAREARAKQLDAETEAAQTRSPFITS